MENYETINGKLYAIHHVLALLVAREGIRTKHPLTDIGLSIKEQITETLQEVSTGQHSQYPIDVCKDFSTSISQEIDSIFLLAESYYNAMPDKE